MRVKVQKWGNSLAVRIPRPCAADAGVSEGTVVDLVASEGRLVAVRTRDSRKFRLEDLLAKVTRANLHTEVDTGAPAGREIW